MGCPACCSIGGGGAGTADGAGIKSAEEADTAEVGAGVGKAAGVGRAVEAAVSHITVGDERLGRFARETLLSAGLRMEANCCLCSLATCMF